MTPSPRLPLAAALLLAAGCGGAAAGGCGPGALALPGSSVCVRLGGLARAEAAAVRAPALAPAGAGGRGRAAAAIGGRVDLDARAPTAYGPLRAYLSVGTRGAR